MRLLTMNLVVPSRDLLGPYVDALKRGFFTDNIRREAAAREDIELIARDPDGFLLRANDRDAKAGPITLSDGSQVPRLPGYLRWMWDGEFCGQIGFRWQPGTEALPRHVLGHIGYAVVPWKRRRGYATRALGLLLEDVRREGLAHVELTTDPDNQPSQKVILANGGQLVGRFRPEAGHGLAQDHLLWRIPL